MNCTLSNVIIFAVGAAIGSAVTWKFVKEKYERIANEEIASMREYIRKKEDKKSEEVEQEDDHAEQVEEYMSTLKNNGYISKEVDYMASPRVISPDEFGENPDEYEPVSLTYYADGVLADEMDEVIENVDEIVGEGSLSTFGEYEKDSVFVRNDMTKCDYEILRDTRNYSDVAKLYHAPRVEE